MQLAQPLAQSLMQRPRPCLSHSGGWRLAATIQHAGRKQLLAALRISQPERLAQCSGRPAVAAARGRGCFAARAAATDGATDSTARAYSNGAASPSGVGELGYDRVLPCIRTPSVLKLSATHHLCTHGDFEDRSVHVPHVIQAAAGQNYQRTSILPPRRNAYTTGKPLVELHPQARALRVFAHGIRVCSLCMSTLWEIAALRHMPCQSNERLAMRISLVLVFPQVGGAGALSARPVGCRRAVHHVYAAAERDRPPAHGPCHVCHHSGAFFITRELVTSTREPCAARWYIWMALPAPVNGFQRSGWHGRPDAGVVRLMAYCCAGHYGTLCAHAGAADAVVAGHRPRRHRHPGGSMIPQHAFCVDSRVRASVLLCKKWRRI